MPFSLSALFLVVVKELGHYLTEYVRRPLYGVETKKDEAE